MNDVTHGRIAVAPGIALDFVERGHGPAVLFLHGFTDSLQSFELILPLLPRDLRAIAVSQRGHGDSDRPQDGYAIEQLALDAVAVLDGLGIDRATVVGHSMGSLVAREIARTRPERVSRLVLVGTTASFASPVAHELEAAVATLTDPVPDEFAREFQSGTAWRPLEPGFLDRVVAGSLKLPARVWKAALAGNLAYRTTEGLGQLPMPVLIVGGEHDPICTPAMHRDLHGQIPGSTLLLYDEVAHSPHWEAPQRFVDDLVAFVGRGTARAGETSPAA